MKKTSLKIKILSGMLCTSIVLSGASLSFAAEKDNGSAKVTLASSMDIKAPMDKEKLKQERHAERKATLETVIKESVAAQIITKDEGDKVLAHIKAKAEKISGDNKADRIFKRDKKCKDGKCEGARGGLFTDLVTGGILTKEKADALRQKMYIKTTELRNEKIKKGLDNLVVSKVLTAEQGIKVKEAILAKDAERKENYKKIRNMSENERKDYMKNNKGSKVNPVKALVDNGTITKLQAKEIKKILPTHNHKGK